MITIDAAGKVINAEAKADTPSRQAHPVLQKTAAENIRHWTFVEPSSAPHSQEIAFDYEIDDTLPPSGGPSNSPSITKVSFDLPDHVTILTNAKIVDTDKSRTHD